MLRTPRETTQPNRKDLEYWAGGLTPVYLEGALQRAIDAELAADDSLEPLADEAPAQASPLEPAAQGADAVLDPFAVYLEGEDLVRLRLEALSAHHLRRIVRAFGLGQAWEDLGVLDEPALIALIIAGVRARLAA